MKLRYSVPLLVGSSSLVVAAVGLLMLARESSVALHEESEAQLRARLTELQAAVEGAGRKETDASLAEAVTSIAADPRVAFAALVGSEGEVLAATELALVGAPLHAAALEPLCGCGAEALALLAAELHGTPHVRSSSLRFHVGAAIAELLLGSRDGRPLPTKLLVVYDAGGDRAAFDLELRRHGGLVALLTLLPAFLLFPLLRFSVGARILRLVDLARAIGRGEHVPPGSLTGDDELAALAEGLDQAGTELRVRSERMARSERDLHEIFSKALTPLVVGGPDHVLLRANPAACALLGLGEADVIGRRSDDFIAPESLAALPNQWEQVQPNRRIVTRRHLLDVEGRRVPVEITASLLEGDRVLMHLRDLRPQLRDDALRDQLQQSDRLASLGTLAAGVAHEINNPISYVRSNLGFALEELTAARASPDVIEALTEARTGADRVGQLVADLKQFARTPTIEQTALELVPLVERTVKLARASTKHTTQLAFELGEVPLVLGSEGRLSQVVLNLLVNAVQAMPPRPERENLIVLRTATDPDGFARVEVEDNGAGIPAEVQARLFEPFFTTKPPGQGTGLGLSISREIVEAHQGTLTVRSTVGAGTCFTLRLPPATGAKV